MLILVSALMVFTLWGCTKDDKNHSETPTQTVTPSAGEEPSSSMGNTLDDTQREETNLGDEMKEDASRAMDDVSDAVDDLLDGTGKGTE